jgi:hypothetical protein
MQIYIRVQCKNSEVHDSECACSVHGWLKGSYIMLPCVHVVMLSYVHLYMCSCVHTVFTRLAPCMVSPLEEGIVVEEVGIVVVIVVEEGGVAAGFEAS